MKDKKDPQQEIPTHKHPNKPDPMHDPDLQPSQKNPKNPLPDDSP